MEALSHNEKVQAMFIANMGRIRGMVAGMVGDLSLAEDIVQEVFVVVTRKAEEFDLETNFLAWVKAIVRFKSLELRRKQGNQPLLLSEEALNAVADACPEDETDWDARRAALAECLKKLPSQARRIISLRYADAMAVAKIAETISWSLNAVGVQLSRSRHQLRNCVRRSFATGEMQ